MRNVLGLLGGAALSLAMGSAAAAGAPASGRIVEVPRFNMVLWRGLRPGVPYPTAREDPDIAVAPDRDDDGD